MIGLAILAKMAEDGVANLALDKNCWWEQAPLSLAGKPAQGVWAVTRGGSAENSPKGLNLHETVDLYVALANKAESELAHQCILEWVLAHRCICELSGIVEGVAYDYHNVRIRPTTTPSQYLITQNGMVVKTASIEVVYDINTNKEKK